MTSASKNRPFVQGLCEMFADDERYRSGKPGLAPSAGESSRAASVHHLERHI